MRTSTTITITVIVLTLPLVPDNYYSFMTNLVMAIFLPNTLSFSSLFSFLILFRFFFGATCDRNRNNGGATSNFLQRTWGGRGTRNSLWGQCCAGAPRVGKAA